MSKHSGSVVSLLKGDLVGQQVTVKGWVRHKRGSSNVSFITVNDGSTQHNIQVVAEAETIAEEVLKLVSTGASISATGQMVESSGSGQKVEIKAEKIEILGEANVDEYPLQPKKHSLEYLRSIAHLRFRTNTFSAVFRIRHAMSYAVHKYFNDNGYFMMHTPIITGSDAEGAGEMFKVTNFDLDKTPKTESGEIDFSKDFFGKETNLTVSGQLEAELGALGLGKVYTFGPTFRAENSNTPRHLAEFWMIEPEVAFNELVENMDLSEDFLKYLCQYALDNCADDLAFLEAREIEEEKGLKAELKQSMPLTERLKFITENEFVRLSYSDAIRELKNSKPYKKKKFEFEVAWGKDLQSEHEKFLVERKFKKPVIVYDYPASFKAFYMRQNDADKYQEGQTVAAMDVLFPAVGEIIGGSQREERLDILKQKCADFNIPEEHVWWYLETRKFGTVPHSGFGMGFERLVLFVTGMKNIRDVIPFPRAPKNAEF